MKKKHFIPLVLIAAIILITACQTTPSAVSGSVNDVNPSENIQKDTPYSFEGYWVLNNGSLILIQGRAFMIWGPDKSLAANGIISNQDNKKLTLHYIDDMREPSELIINYTVKSKEEVNVTSEVSWLNGIWIKNREVNEQLAKVNNTIPFLGYWEDEKGGRALHFSQFGFGFQYYFNEKYIMDGFPGSQNDKIQFSICRYNPKSLTDDFDGTLCVGGYFEIAGMLASTDFNFKWPWKIEGNNLLIKWGTQFKYIKR